MTGLVAAISALGGAFGVGAGAGALGGFFSTVGGRLLASVALSALSQALIPKPRAPGIRTTVTQTGGTVAAAFILGSYATAGSAVCPPLSHGKVGKTPNAYLTYVIAVSDVPRVGLSGLVVDGETVEILPDTDPDYGNKVGGEYLDRMWIKFKNGQQTVADPMLVDKYGADPDFPWTSDMVGEGIAHAIVTFRYDREVFSTFPDVRFVIDGIPLYDPRQDSSVGGSGDQRWNNRNTWEFSQNPVVMIYNILRGIRIGKLSSDLFWGGNAAADDLPLSNWIAAMNICDQQIPLGAGGTQTRFRAGFEVSVDDEPASVIEELLKACNGQLVDLGGEWKIRVGGPGLPVMFITDEDILISRAQDFDPFPGVEATYNAITTTYPEPASQWEAKEAPPRTNATWEAEDGGRRLMARLDLPAVPYSLQAQRLSRAFIRDHRRMRRHNLSLGGAAAKLEPLDVIGWTSAVNGYVSKSFELPGTDAELTRCTLTCAAREVDPTDYDWSSDEELPSVPVTGVIRRPAPQVAVGFTVEGVYSDDGSERPRKPAIRLAWDAEALDDAVAIEWQMRRVGRTNIGWEGSMRNVAAGEKVLAGGIVPGVSYEARIRPAFANRKRAWTAWQSATAPAVFLSDPDFGDDDNAFRAFMRARNITPVEIVSTLPTAAPADPDDLVNYQGEIYRWNGSAWTKAVPVSDLDGQITDAAIFASTIRPVEVLAALPAPSDPANVIGRQVHLTTDNKVYRWTGTEWTVKTDGADILAGSIYAQSLALADFTNLVPDNQLINPASWALLDPGITFFDNSAALGAPPEASIGWIRFEPSGALQRAQSRPFPVTPGDRLYLSAQMWRRSGTGSATIRLQINFLDRNGGFISGANVTATGTGVARYVGNATVPANAQTAVVQGRVEAGGSGDWVFTSPIVRRKASGTLNVDGSIAASEIDTDFLSVAGLAVFGGALASANYASGVSGWRIDRNGNAELNSLIVRTGMLDANATGFNAETYSLALEAWGHTVGNPSTFVGGPAISITITDPAVVGKPLTVTFSAEARITRSVIGNVQGNMAIVVGGTQTATYSLRSYISQANGLHITPISFTRRIVAPAVPFTVSTVASTTPVGADDHSASLGLRARSLQVQVRKDEA